MDRYVAGSFAYADLSPAVGEELGGVRLVKILRQNGSLVTVLPFRYVGRYEPVFEQIRTIDTKRIRERVFYLESVKGLPK